ncbi:MAG: RecX family transcriptional regulator [Acholeplasmatales bacterium]|nr:RecX family transcriptional regulator [Acholeplasmatales bacterium]
MSIVKSVSKIKNKNNYNVIIDDKSYIFDEDTILEYKLFKDKEIEEIILDKALESSNIHLYYDKALKYSLKYAKGSKEVYQYLIEKGLDCDKSRKIVDKLVEKRIIDDSKIVEGIVYSLVKSYNGKKMIYEKLKQKKFDVSIINEALNNIDYDLYIEYLNKLYEKIKDKYNKFDDYIRKNKIKSYLYQRGYDSNDISLINIE